MIPWEHTLIVLRGFLHFGVQMLVAFMWALIFITIVEVIYEIRKAKVRHERSRDS